MFTASNYDNRSKLRLVSFCVVFIFWSLFEANKLLQRKNVEMPRKNAEVPRKNAEMQPRNTEMPLKKRRNAVKDTEKSPKMLPNAERFST